MGNTSSLLLPMVLLKPTPSVLIQVLFGKIFEDPSLLFGNLTDNTNFHILEVSRNVYANMIFMAIPSRKKSLYSFSHVLTECHPYGWGDGSVSQVFSLKT